MMGIDQFLWAPIFIPGFLAVTGAVHQQNLGESMNFQNLMKINTMAHRIELSDVK